MLLLCCFCHQSLETKQLRRELIEPTAAYEKAKCQRNPTALKAEYSIIKIKLNKINWQQFHMVTPPHPLPPGLVFKSKIQNITASTITLPESNNCRDREWPQRNRISVLACLMSSGLSSGTREPLRSARVSLVASNDSIKQSPIPLTHQDGTTRQSVPWRVPGPQGNKKAPANDLTFK